jgi:signal peptidase II
MKRWRYLILAPMILIAHQLARLAAFRAVNDHGGPIAVLPFFNLVEVWNPGISFGMFNGLVYAQWLLSALAIAITLILLRWLSRAENKITAMALSFVIGGAVGNTIDRLRFGAVADYLDFHIYGKHWPAFNVTDMAIVVGVGLLMLREFAVPKRGRETRSKPM